ncbi:hypothetical protein Lal_00047642 [Lupinus albus]|nr:hypothetical protein Lal_00047642 [Lupinus albus]
MTDHVLSYYMDMFATPNNSSPNSLIQFVVPNLMSYEDNDLLTKLPTNEEIKDAVFAMNGDGAPGPDGFWGCFYQNLSDIVRVEDLITLKAFNIAINIDKAPKIIEVCWQPPKVGWIKVNSDGAGNGLPGLVGGGGIFRDSNGVLLACFASYLHLQDALFAELFAAMKAIRISYKRGWWNLWLECDSTLVMDIFNSRSKAPWKLQNEWLLCMKEIAQMNLCIAQMNLCISYIHREGNSCANKLTLYDITSRRNSTWVTFPKFISIEYKRNRYMWIRWVSNDVQLADLVGIHASPSQKMKQ